MSASLDCSCLDMHTAQRAYVDIEPTHGVTYDFPLFHQTSTESQYKSQNPSPKHGSHKYHYYILPISPLSTPIGYQQDSETEDMDTSSASSIAAYEHILIEKQAQRQSAEDIIDADDEDCCDHKIGKLKTYSFDDKDMQLIVMEAQLNDLNEKVLDLMTIIKELKDRNKYLITSKLELINNTSDAMNECRNTINKLNKQNTILLTKMNKT
eukprot:UN01032